jgi:hypothetical protein
MMLRLLALADELRASAGAVWDLNWAGNTVAGGFVAAWYVVGGGEGAATRTGVRRAVGGGGRVEGGGATPRFGDLLVGESAGESGDGAGERGPLAVFALLLWPAGEGAERYWEVGEGAEVLLLLWLLLLLPLWLLMDGYGEPVPRLERRELLEPRVGTSSKSTPSSLAMSSVPLRSSRNVGRESFVEVASRDKGEWGRPARGDLEL